MITGPTFDEMLHPQTIDPSLRAQALAALDGDPLNPLNLYNITWRDAQNQVYHFVLPKALTGVDANIVVIYGGRFPSGSHKVGAAYSVLLEKQLMGEVDPDEHTLVWPSTGNYGIGGAFIGCRMEYDSIVVLPEEMSAERFERIASYGARIIRTTGSESNVKEIYDEVNRLRGSDSKMRILNQFEVMGNYRFHYHVTGNTLVELAAELREDGIGAGAKSPPMSRRWAARGRWRLATASSKSGASTKSSGWSRCNARRSTTMAMARTKSRASATSMSPGFTMSSIWTR